MRSLFRISAPNLPQMTISSGKNRKREPGKNRIPFQDYHGAEGGTRTPTGFPTTPSRSRCLMVTGARAFFPIQLNPVQYTYSPPERLRLHVHVGLRRQSDIRVGAVPFAIMQSTGKGTVH